jgi:hypothetical protein
MRKHAVIGVLLAVLLLILACGGAKSRGMSTASAGAAKPQTTYDFGRSTTWQSLYNVVVDLLERYNYHRTQVGTPTLVETDWRVIAPDTTEANLGLFETRHKVTVSITTRREIAVATLRLTCEARYENGPWLKSNPNSEVVRIVQEMQRQAKLELSQYIQQW